MTVAVLLELEPLLLADAARAVVKGDPRALLAAYVVLPDQRGLLDCLLDAHSTAPAAAQPFVWSGQHVAALGIRPVWTRPADRVVTRRPISDSLPHSAYQRPRTAGDAEHARSAPETARQVYTAPALRLHYARTAPALRLQLLPCACTAPALLTHSRGAAGHLGARPLRHDQSAVHRDGGAPTS